MSGNYAFIGHFKIPITTVNEHGPMVTRAEERKLPNNRAIRSFSYK